MKLPTPTEVAAVAGAVGMLGQYFGFVLPLGQQGIADRDANWSARDQLKLCNTERGKLLETILEIAP